SPRFCVGYARVSTTDQAENGHSLAAQEAKIHEYCRLHDLTLAGVLVALLEWPRGQLSRIPSDGSHRIASKECA
ncbi:MAG: recombinase family protein, partial [Akkermansiaceae bacterium]|nr:recombinase family protein [Akkermansiaceae bacterium]